MKDSRTSGKLGVVIRRIRLRDGTHWSIRPSFVMPYMAARTEDVQEVLFLRKFAVPFWALADVFGRDPMFYYRLQNSLGRFSLAGTTVRRGTLPANLLASADDAGPLSETGVVVSDIRSSGGPPYEQHAGSSDAWHEPLLRLHATSSWRSEREPSDLPKPGVVMELQSVASVANPPTRLAKPGGTTQPTSLSRPMAAESADFSVLRRLSSTSPKSVTVSTNPRVNRENEQLTRAVILKGRQCHPHRNVSLLANLNPPQLYEDVERLLMPPDLSSARHTKRESERDSICRHSRARHVARPGTRVRSDGCHQQRGSVLDTLAVQVRALFVSRCVTGRSGTGRELLDRKRLRQSGRRGQKR